MKLYIVVNTLNCYIDTYPSDVEVIEIDNETYNKLAKGEAEWVNGEIKEIK